MPLSGSGSFSPNIANTGMFFALAAASAVSIALSGWPEMAMKLAPASTACCIEEFGPCGSDGS
jgi:hypothetical protein